jgi:lipopolysaccharide export system protein LptA
MKARPCHCLLAAVLALAAGPASSEKADRSKPVTLEADRVTVDDKNKVSVFEGRVTLTQGTLQIKADRIVVSQDVDGFQKGVASGGPGGLARIRQKRDSADYMEGEAERIEHDGNTERTQFFGRAFVRSGQDEARGQYIAYDGASASYTVTSGPDGTVAKAVPGRDTRVRVVIQPKNKDVPKTDAPSEARE